MVVTEAAKRTPSRIPSSRTQTHEFEPSSNAHTPSRRLSLARVFDESDNVPSPRALSHADLLQALDRLSAAVDENSEHFHMTEVAQVRIPFALFFVSLCTQSVTVLLRP